MIEMKKVLDAFATEQGTILIAYLSRLFLYKENPEQVDDAETIAAGAKQIAEIISKGQTVPEGVETEQYITSLLAVMIQSLEEELGVVDHTIPVTERIPPRPLPNGSRYLNPEEVNWLVKYDPEVKAAAYRYLELHRKFQDLTGVPDERAIEVYLDMLYKINRKDPEWVAEHPFAGASFFEQFEKETPEEIIICFFDFLYESNKHKVATNSENTPTSKRKTELLEQKKRNQLLGMVFLFVVPPVGIYFLYKASRIAKEIDSL